MPRGSGRAAQAAGSARRRGHRRLRALGARGQPVALGELPAAACRLRGGERLAAPPARAGGEAGRKPGGARGSERPDRRAGRSRGRPRCNAARPGRRRHSGCPLVKARPLEGRGIVITRPRDQAPALAERIRAAGGEPILFPTIEILPPENPGEVSEVIARLEQFHLAIFISPTAAQRGHAMTTAIRTWPESLRVAAVGEGTAKALADLGFRDVIAPRGEGDSEALAALAEMQDLRGRSVVVFRGQGGREWLGQALEKRGARLEYAECYRRARPAAEPRALLAKWQSGGVDAVSITSSEGLANFFAMLGPTGGGYLRATPVFVPHPRIELAAQKLEIRTIIVTGRGDERTSAEMAAFFARV